MITLDPAMEGTLLYLGDGLLRDGYVSARIEPGDMTRYELVVAKNNFPGAMYTVALVNFGRAMYWDGGDVHAEYVSEKLGLGGGSSATVAELLSLLARASE